MRIVVPDDAPPVLSGSPAELRLRSLGDVVIHTETGAHEEDELIRRCREANIVLNLRGYPRFTERVLDRCVHLRFISRWGTGMDHIDIPACTRRGIVVRNTPHIDSDQVAEHTLALMLALVRRIPMNDRAMRTGRWPSEFIEELRGKTVGIIGLGAIGSRVAVLARAIGMTTLAWTFGPDNGRTVAVGARPVALDELLQTADVVTLHLLLSSATHAFLEDSRMALLKPSAYLVNTARGALVDKGALLRALSEGRLAGAALDVFHEEPVASDDPLLAMPNVVLTPHNGGLTPAVTRRSLDLAVEHIRAFLQSAEASRSSSGRHITNRTDT
jgi:phosphoglycerate dehydrogenase-like enzyme